MGKYTSSQGHAFRLFTEAHLHLFPEGIDTLISAGKVEKVKARSFIPFQPVLKETPEELFPLYVNVPHAPEYRGPLADWPAFAKTHGIKESQHVIDTYERLYKRVKECQGGYGLPIEMLGYGRPSFQLHASYLSGKEEELIKLEKQVIKAYEYPILPLSANAEDHFAEELHWRDETLVALRQVFEKEYQPDVPTDSNHRVTLFVYNNTKKGLVQQHEVAFKDLRGLYQNLEQQELQFTHMVGQLR